MFKDNVNSAVIGTVKITDADTGEVLLKKRNAIHPGNMAYVIACALAGQPTTVDASGTAPAINWMAFGNEGSVASVSTLEYKSPKVSGFYDQRAYNASDATLYRKVYQQETDKVVYFPGQSTDEDVTIPENTAKVNFRVALDKDLMEAFTGELVPTSDNQSSDTYTFDEIALVAGVRDDSGINFDENSATMLTHVTFHPILVSKNRNIIIDYTITLQIG